MEISELLRISLPTKGLVLKPFWAELIVVGDKLWEIRSRRTSFRGRAAIIAGGTGKIIGECQITSCKKLTKELFEKNVDKHRILCNWDQLPDNYKNGYIWEIEPGTAKKYSEPVEYHHPKGAVIWVDLMRPDVVDLKYRPEWIGFVEYMLRLSDGTYVALWMSDNKSFTPGCDYVYGYIWYDKRKKILDGGEMDFAEEDVGNGLLDKRVISAIINDLYYLEDSKPTWWTITTLDRFENGFEEE